MSNLESVGFSYVFTERYTFRISSFCGNSKHLLQIDDGESFINYSPTLILRKKKNKPAN